MTGGKRPVTVRKNLSDTQGIFDLNGTSPAYSFINQSLPHFSIIHFVSTTSFSILLGRTIIQGKLEELLLKCVFGGKDKEKCIMGKVEVGRGMDLRVNSYFDCLSYGFKTSKT